MPVCFSLTDKSTGQVAVLSAVDDAMCAHFGVEPDPVKYYHSWFDTIGLAIACGLDEVKLHETWDGHRDHKVIIDWLLTHYTPSGWHEVK